ncbi:sister chromatid cohesion protein PDS5 [Geosmithia morbida]|uniref:Sister chromatid cohesion protein PDS5 n=1 Tax=Geosmithia morbida TaxID=1094350 RepID=A0A9P4YWK3_9HYPO|nr:sister chromatid cohesion protein PDS5 [Geosmithia morbida]KAF4124185.1 sister chromatid cohesion protein PDS5 [Geosmithia morbida]
MVRRRARTREAAKEEAAPAEQPETLEPEIEQQEEPGNNDDEQHRNNGDGDDDDDDDNLGDLPILQFDEELSWRPAKPIASATLVARLERLSKELAEFDQGSVDLGSIKDVAEKLAHRNLMQHRDKGVKAYTACCLVDILRLFVPDAPFTDDQLKIMFGLFVKDILPALHDPTNPYNTQNKYVLVSLTEVKSILLLFDINGSDDLLLRLFNNTFDGVSNSSKSKTGEEVAKDIEFHLTEMLVQLVDEAPGSIPAGVIDAIISQFLRAAPPGGARSRDTTQSTLLHKTEPPAYIMARRICTACTDKMARYVSQYFGDVILNASGFATKAIGRRQDEDEDEEDANAGPSEADLKSLRQAHLLIRELWRAAPTVLENVVPQIDAELSADNVYLRQIATETIGDMIAGIGAAGPPPPPSLDPTLYPPLRLLDDPTGASSANSLTTPYSPQSFPQTHTPVYRNFVGRKNDKSSAIRAAWATACGHILATSAGGIGLSRVEENELIKALAEKLCDSEEKVRLSAVKAIELFDFRDIILKLGATGGVDKQGTIFGNLGDRSRDKRASVRVEAMVLLAKLWAVGSGELADGQEAAAVTACLYGIPSKIINAFYANDADLNVLLDRVMFECLIPLKYPMPKGRDSKSKSSEKKGGLTQAEQDTIRSERILLMVKSLDTPAQKAFFAMQARQPQFAMALGVFISQCEAFNGGASTAASQKAKAKMDQTLQWFGPYFPDPLKVKADLQKLAKVNDRRAYQLIKYAIESESDFQKVRRSIHELIPRIQSGNAASSLDTVIPLLYRSCPLVYNRSHLATIMDYSKSDKDGFASVAHAILNDISTRNPDLFKTHSEELRKTIIDQAPTVSKANDVGVVDILKAYSSYAKKYPDEVQSDKTFSQTLANYALYGQPHKAAKYAVNILLTGNDSKSKVTATNLLQKASKDLKYDTKHLLNKLATISQLERLAPTVTADSDDVISSLTIDEILRSVRTDASDSDPSWVNDTDMDEELQAKCLSIKVLVNRALSNTEEPSAAEERAKPLFKLLMTLITKEGELSKDKDRTTPLHHRKRLRLLAGQSILKLCTVKEYDDQFDPRSFNQLAELVQDSEFQVRRRFMDKLQNHLTRGRLRPRFYVILFLAAFEPVADVKVRTETWLRSRTRYYAENSKSIMEAMIGRLIPLLAHHPDYSSQPEDLEDFAKYILFYLSTVASEANIAHIYKYAERVKQTRDALSPEASENLYVLSDLTQAVIRKYQERKGWSFQAWPDKVGLPTGLYTALPSSEVAQQIAKKQYISDELDEKLDDVIRAQERKKKRKSVHDLSEQTAKKPKGQFKTVIREKATPKPKAAKKKKATSSRPKKASPPPVPLSERRRSGRATVSSSYRERDDDEDEEEMLDGVASWDYGDDDDDDDEEDGSSNDEEEENEEDLPMSDNAEEETNGDGNEEEEEEQQSKSKSNTGRGARSAAAGKKTSTASRSSRTRGRRVGGKPDSDMDNDNDE